MPNMKTCEQNDWWLFKMLVEYKEAKRRGKPNEHILEYKYIGVRRMDIDTSAWLDHTECHYSLKKFEEFIVMKPNAVHIVASNYRYYPPDQYLLYMKQICWSYLSSFVIFFFAHGNFFLLRLEKNLDETSRHFYFEHSFMTKSTFCGIPSLNKKGTILPVQCTSKCDHYLCVIYKRVVYVF